jgi:hypothetical protein
MKASGSSLRTASMRRANRPVPYRRRINESTSSLPDWSGM